MEGVGGCGFEKVARPVKENVLRLGDGGFQQTLITNSMQTAKLFDCDMLQSLNLLNGQKRGFAHEASFFMSGA